MATFDDTDYEVLQNLEVQFKVTDSTPNPLFPTRPTISFVGDVRGNCVIKGSISMTAEKEVRWRFVSLNSRLPITVEI